MKTLVIATRGLTLTAIPQVLIAASVENTLIALLAGVCSLLCVIMGCLLTAFLCHIANHSKNNITPELCEERHENILKELKEIKNVAGAN